jgi:16S rRNA (cytosine967-C5)-methyltransferase
LAIVLAKPKDVTRARLAAFEILRRVDAGAFSTVLLASDELELQPSDRALCHELVMGVLRWQLFLDKIIEHFSKRKVEKLDLAVRLALRLGLYQLRFLTRVPGSAAVNESVSLVHRARLSSAAAFVNALLRRATREPDYDPSVDVSDPIERIAIQTSHPRWLIERWSRSLGLDEIALFASFNNKTPATVFRTVRTRANHALVFDELRAAGGILQASLNAKHAWQVTGAGALVRELAAAGRLYLQDDASQLVAEILDAQPGERVLDLCAAPGGKTTMIADLADDRAVVIAADISERRLATVKSTARLHKLGSIVPVILDAGRALPFKSGVFDRVLVDAPCSGTGTLRRNPEIRWRISAEDIQSLASRQIQFLRNAADSIKPGGRLVYSTCSVETEENEDVVREFLATDSGFQFISGGDNSSPTTRTWPQRHGSDGFFIAALERKRV